MSDFRMPDSYYEPPDEDEREGEHEEDCIIEHDLEDSECFTIRDAEEEVANMKWDRMRDGD